MLGNIGPRSWQYGPSAARSVQKRPRAMQYSPVRLEQATEARLVSRLSFVLTGNFQFAGFRKPRKRSLIVAKSQPRKNQTQRSDLPQDCPAI